MFVYLITVLIKHCLTFNYLLSDYLLTKINIVSLLSLLIDFFIMSLFLNISTINFIKLRICSIFTKFQHPCFTFLLM